MERRSFLGGLAGLLTAAGLAKEVPKIEAAAAAQVALPPAPRIKPETLGDYPKAPRTGKTIDVVKPKALEQHPTFRRQFTEAFIDDVRLGDVAECSMENEIEPTYKMGSMWGEYRPTGNQYATLSLYMDPSNADFAHRMTTDFAQARTLRLETFGQTITMPVRLLQYQTEFRQGSLAMIKMRFALTGRGTSVAREA